MKITCAIVDDEYPARLLLSEYVKKIPGLTLVGLYKNPLALTEAMAMQEIDLVFLDIQMPEITGIEFLKTLKNNRPFVVLTTAYADYALDGYELDVTDYLLKPFSFERFLQAVSKTAERIHLKRQNQKALPEQKQEYILIKAASKTHRIKLDTVFYIEGLKEYVSFYTVTGRIISLLSLKYLEETLPGDTFLRIHKSYIVNKKKVTALNGNQLEVEHKLLPIGKFYKEQVNRLLFT